MNELALRLITYMESRGDVVFRTDNALNIVYLEGANFDGTPNNDAPDRWNDMRYLITFKENYPIILFAQVATTEPGIAPTHSPEAAKRGGVGRIILGQQKGWKVGYHKHDTNHPALVQCAEILVNRDIDKNYMRTGDPVRRATGLNQHGTRLGYDGNAVGYWSEACLVGKDFAKHIEFMKYIKAGPEFQKDPDHVYHTAVYGADSFYIWCKKNYADVV